MKCLIDTNILVSACGYPDSVPAKALKKAAEFPCCALICSYSLSEMLNVVNKKFPHKINIMQEFLLLLCLETEIIRTPAEKESVCGETKIRDVKDRPIFRAAVAANADIIITGDRDFLESGLTNPRIMSSSDFVNLELEN